VIAESGTRAGNVGSSSDFCSPLIWECLTSDLPSQPPVAWQDEVTIIIIKKKKKKKYERDVNDCYPLLLTSSDNYFPYIEWECFVINYF
jgi:hypothetical protein